MHALCLDQCEGLEVQGVQVSKAVLSNFALFSGWGNPVAFTQVNHQDFFYRISFTFVVYFLFYEVAALDWPRDP